MNLKGLELCLPRLNCLEGDLRLPKVPTSRKAPSTPIKSYLPRPNDLEDGPSLKKTPTSRQRLIYP